MKKYIPTSKKEIVSTILGALIGILLPVFGIHLPLNVGTGAVSGFNEVPHGTSN